MITTGGVCFISLLFGVAVTQIHHSTKTLVVDDTAFMRRALVDTLSRDPEIEVVGVAKHGKEALEAIQVFDPDVVTLDVDMPVMDGLTTIKHIMVRGPRPIVMVSSLAGQGAVTLEALRLGAVDFFPKPSGTISMDIHKRGDELSRVVKQASRINPSAIRRVRLLHGETGPFEKCNKFLGVVIVGAHRGACGNLIRLLANVQPKLPVSIIVLQDISSQVLESYSKELNNIVQWDICADKQSVLVQGKCLIANYNNPWSVRRMASGTFEVTCNQAGNADLMFEEAAQFFGNRCLAVMIGGTSDQGVRGLLRVRQAGGTTLALAPDACVYGDTSMAALSMGAAEAVASELELWSKIKAFGRRLYLETAGSRT